MRLFFSSILQSQSLTYSNALRKATLYKILPEVLFPEPLHELFTRSLSAYWCSATEIGIWIVAGDGIPVPDNQPGSVIQIGVSDRTSLFFAVISTSLLHAKDN